MIMGYQMVDNLRIKTVRPKSFVLTFLLLSNRAKKLYEVLAHRYINNWLSLILLIIIDCYYCSIVLGFHK